AKKNSPRTTGLAGVMDLTPWAGVMDLTPSAGVMDLTPWAGVMDLIPRVAVMDLTPWPGVMDLTPWSDPFHSLTFPLTNHHGSCSTSPGFSFLHTGESTRDTQLVLFPQPALPHLI
uniref:Uncharacterized protein n=1 Tax=Catharus ustulatus TaxID=91951 RepID=A0A8C3Y207_CATUS